jgi:hypothetical protein
MDVRSISYYLYLLPMASCTPVVQYPKDTYGEQFVNLMIDLYAKSIDPLVGGFTTNAKFMF